MNDKDFVWCKCATYDPDTARHDCSVSGSGCMFMLPNAATCRDVYGEGPLAPYPPEEGEGHDL